jgi:integrase
LNYAVRWELAPRNVTDLVDKPSPKRKPVEPLTVAQVQIFLEAARPHRWYPIYVTALYCGMREGEVLGIHVEDLDLEKGVLHVNNAVQYIIG